MKDVVAISKRFEQLENLKRSRKNQLSAKVKLLYSWIADVKKTDCLYLFELSDEMGRPEYDVYYKDGKFFKASWTPEPIYNPNEDGAYYVTYSRLPKLLYTAMGKIRGYVEESQKQFNEEFKLNKILNCIKKG